MLAMTIFSLGAFWPKTEDGTKLGMAIAPAVRAVVFRKVRRFMGFIA
jgi:hypothetical protein